MYTVHTFAVNSCDKSQQNVPYVYFDNFVICAESKRVSNKLSDDTKLINIGLWRYKQKMPGVCILILSIYFAV